MLDSWKRMLYKYMCKSFAQIICEVIVLKRLTELRKEILRIIETSEVPLNAEEIYQKLETKPNLSSVYRGLSFLEDNGMIKSISFDSHVRFFYPVEKNHPLHFIYCKNCRKIEVFNECFADRIQAQIEKKHDCTITDHVFYFIGLCSECRHNYPGRGRET
ncbi:MAG: Fur family transcriptional regulator, ferric uptake regulator [Kosmotoga sp.]|jgi:Fur family ferric uptake transcriptional regulator|nr:Fur family transcriptional regulator, ferric uptake regulator [Kosmotoga sp.]